MIADVRTFDSLGVFGMGVAASITYQSTCGVAGRYDLDPEVVRKQLEELFGDRQPDALKTGMLGRADTVRAVAGFLEAGYSGPVVVDPVLESTDGKPLLERGGLRALQQNLIPVSSLVTPNVKEIEVLCGFEVFEPVDVEAAALFLVNELGARAVLVTGCRTGAGADLQAADVFFDGHGFEVFASPWLEGALVHGTGCVISAAITASLAAGADLKESVLRGREVVRRAMMKALATGSGLVCANPRPAGAEEDWFKPL